MPAPRFFVETDLATGTTVALPPRVAHHAVAVLRLRDGAALVLFNGRGGEFQARLLSARPARAAVDAFDPVERESPLEVTLVQALVAGDKMDWILEKCTELGVARFVIGPAERSTVRLGAERLAARLARWQDIATAACCQCGRNRRPEVGFAPTIADALARAGGSAMRFVFAPGAAGPPEFARASASVTVAVGPEGDWSAAELAHAERLGYRRVLFGPRVLRTETAGVAIVSALQAMAGDIGLRAV